jgi:hypothetical protein
MQAAFPGVAACRNDVKSHEAIKLRLRSHNLELGDDRYPALLLSAVLTVAARLVEALFQVTFSERGTSAFRTQQIMVWVPITKPACKRGW